MNLPHITIIMPVYNAENYLSESIESVLSQSFKKWFLICVNDGSNDSSADIIYSYIKLNKNIRIINNAKNSGNASTARNIALDYVKTKYLYLLDSDDFLSEDLLENLIIRANDEDGIVVCPDVTQFDNKRFFNQKSGLIGDRSKELKPIEAFYLSLDWTVSFRSLWDSNVVKKIKFNEDCMYGDEFSTRKFILNSQKIVFCPGTYFYRVHEMSSTKRFTYRLFERLVLNKQLLTLIESMETEKDILKKQIEVSLKDFLNCCMNFTINKNFKNRTENETIRQNLTKFYSEIDPILRKDALKKISGWRNILKKINMYILLLYFKLIK